MSPYIHLLLVISTALVAGVAVLIAGLNPGTIVSITAAVVGVLLYIRPLDLAGDGDVTIDGTGTDDVG